MIKKYTRIKNIVLPNKRINLLITSILFLGVTIGAIYMTTISYSDKTLVIEKIQTFIDNINHHSLNTINVFRNSISINLIYIFIIWILGMALIGIITSIILLFLKGFIFGFSMASFIITYGLKGIILSFIYLLFGELLNIITVLFISVYSITFSIKLLKLIFNKETKFKILSFFKTYLLVLAICITISIISAVSETFILPPIIKIIIKLFI